MDHWRCCQNYLSKKKGVILEKKKKQSAYIMIKESNGEQKQRPSMDQHFTVRYHIDSAEMCILLALPTPLIKVSLVSHLMHNETQLVFQSGFFW